MKLKVINTILLSFFCLFGSINAQNKQGVSIDRKTKNLLVYYKTYVSVRLFYPDVININWDKYAVAGTELALNSKTDQDLINTLNNFFTPFFPTVYLSNTNQNDTISKPLKKYPYSYKVYDGYKIFYGLSENGDSSDVNENKSDIYDKKLLTVKNEKEEKKYTLKYPVKNQYYFERLIDNISLQFNIIDYKEKSTLSNREKEKLKKERSEIRNTVNKINLDKIFYKEIGIANLLWMMGVIEHFYPYPEQFHSSYNDIVIKYLDKSTKLSSYGDFYLLYRQFISELNDGHADVLAGCYAPLKKPKIGLEYYNNKHVIVCNSEENNVSIGDTIVKIDNKPIDELLDSLKYLYSGSEGWKLYRILNEELLYGNDTILCSLTVLKDGKEIEKTLNRNVLDYRCESSFLEEELPNNGYYFDLTRYTKDSVENIVSALKTNKYVVFDLRGYPIDDIEEFVLPLLGKDTLYSSWFKTPLATAESNFSHYDTTREEPIIPHFVEGSRADIYFLSSEKGVSYTESLIDYISYYKLGTIVGQNTAGADGNYSIVRLPQHFLFTYTAMRAIRLNGELFHVIGVSPDIKIKRNNPAKNLVDDDYIKEIIKRYE